MVERLKLWLLLFGFLILGFVSYLVPIIGMISWICVTILFMVIYKNELFHSKYISKILRYRKIKKYRKFYRLGGIKKVYPFISKVEWNFKDYEDPYVFIYYNTYNSHRTAHKLENDNSNKNTIRGILRNRAD